MGQFIFPLIHTNKIIQRDNLAKFGASHQGIKDVQQKSLSYNNEKQLWKNLQFF